MSVCVGCVCSRQSSLLDLEDCFHCTSVQTLTTSSVSSKIPSTSYDVAIIGAGAVGCAVARELSR